MKTQKVRIKVLIGASGRYTGYGWQGMNDKDPDDTLYEGMNDVNFKEYFLIADVPIPGADAEEIAAKIDE